MPHDVSAPKATDAVALAEIRSDALSVDAVIAAVSHPSCGGVVAFLGVVRDHDSGNSVASLDYTVHPSAPQRLREVAAQVSARHTPARVGVAHRSGHLTVGDIAVVVVAAAPHRDTAFAAARDLIDTLKNEVPIWKHQHFDDGTTQWVGA